MTSPQLFPWQEKKRKEDDLSAQSTRERMEGVNVRRCTYEPGANIFVVFGERPNLCPDYQINGAKNSKKEHRSRNRLTFLGRS